MLRTVDVLDRVTFVDYPDTKLDITYTFDDPAVPFAKGRLTSIGRNGSSVDYRYDRFGRTLQDGALSYLYDRNGNRVEIGYPEGVSATYTFDYADRETSLSVRRGTAPAQVIASNATYKPLGPLTGLTLGNGKQEIRDYDQRYFPSSIQVPGHLHWTYTTDKVGNFLRIRDELVPASTRDYGYQDHQYYLTRGDGPWGDLSWVYDRLGNRLSETRDGVRTDYTYTPNATGKSSAKLASTRPAVAGAETTNYGFDAAGNQIHQTTPSSKVVYAYDDAKRLAEIRSRDADRLQATAIEYDGRSFLKRAVLSLIGDRPFESRVTTATYSSEGILHHKTYDERPTPWSMRGTPRVSGDDYVFYFAGRPVAQLGVEVTSGVEAAKWLFLTTDHLGTPVLATGLDGAIWSGGFEPFGKDYTEASDDGLFLRFPGQWRDDKVYVGEVTYNVSRWYISERGQYLEHDPLGVGVGDINAYSYAAGNPLKNTDSLGLAVWVDKSLQPYLDCARMVPIFRIAWQWFISTDGQWSVQPIDAAPITMKAPQAMPLPPKKSGVPKCSQGGRLFPDNRARWLPPGSTPDPQEQCSQVVESIAHEVLETWAFCDLGLTKNTVGKRGTAHMFVERGDVSESDHGLDDNIADQACNSCRCQQILAGIK